jgi:hypothetical protein
MQAEYDPIFANIAVASAFVVPMIIIIMALIMGKKSRDHARNRRDSEKGQSDKRASGSYIKVPN